MLLTHYRWFVLSAKYSLVEPEQVIVPYDCTLLAQDRQARAEWGERVYRQLAALGLTGETFAAHAGKVYVAPLAGKLRIKTPLAGLGIGQQMAWYLWARAAGQGFRKPRQSTGQPEPGMALKQKGCIR